MTMTQLPAPSLRHHPLYDSPWIAQIPNAQGRIVQRQSFPTRSEAEAWARATWCARHHRTHCPPILWDRSIRGNLRQVAFRKRLASWYAQRDQDPSIYRVTRDLVAGIPTDAYSAPLLARTGMTREAERLVPVAREWVEDPLQALGWYGSTDLPYAGNLDDDTGAPTPMLTDRTVFWCPGVSHETPPHRLRQAWAFASDRSGILWSPGAQPHDPPRVWGAFLGVDEARTYAVEVLGADYVAPHYHPTVAALDWDGLVPLRGLPVEAAEPDPVGDLLTLITASAYAVPLAPDGPWALVRQQSDTGAPEWLSADRQTWQAHPPKRWTIPAKTALSEEFATWCDAHQVVTLSAVPSWALGVG